MVRTKVTFTAQSGTSTDGFCAVLDLLCSIFHSKRYAATDVLRKKRWKTKGVFLGRSKISKECSDLFWIDTSRAAVMKICTEEVKKDKMTNSRTVYQNYVPN